jgi:hypothetical protein
VKRSHEEHGADGEAKATGVDLAEQLAGVLIEGKLDIIAAILGVRRGQAKENSAGCRCGKRDASERTLRMRREAPAKERFNGRGCDGLHHGLGRHEQLSRLRDVAAEEHHQRGRGGRIEAEECAAESLHGQRECNPEAHNAVKIPVEAWPARKPVNLEVRAPVAAAWPPDEDASDTENEEKGAPMPLTTPPVSPPSKR